MDDVAEIVQLAKKIVLDTGYFEPTVFIKGSERKLAVQPETFGQTADDRQRNMLNMGAYIAYKQNVGELEILIFADEAWMSKPDKNGEFIQPSLDPKRIETLIINSLDARTQEETMICFEMVRNTQGKVTNLKQMSLPDGGSVKGNLLPAFQKGYQFIRPVRN